MGWSENILRLESKASDIHGVICETTKHATSTGGICEFKNVFSYGSSDQSGWLRFKPNEFNTESEIKCFKQVKPGFEVEKDSC